MSSKHNVITAWNEKWSISIILYLLSKTFSSSKLIVLHDIRIVLFYQNDAGRSNERTKTDK